MRKADIENAILSSFLFANDTSNDLSWIFKLDTSIFTSTFRKRVAEKINDVDDEAYGYLSWTLENKYMGTHDEQEFIEILAALPLSTTKKYHDKLVSETRMGELC